jgi:hypothetical protein
MSGQRLDEVFHVLKVIRRIVDDALDRIGRHTPEDDDPMGIAAWLKAIAAMARATADDWRDAGDLVELHRFCRHQIDSYERMAIKISIDGLMAVSTLQEIQRSLADANILPRTGNRGPEGKPL